MAWFCRLFHATNAERHSIGFWCFKCRAYRARR